MIVKPRLLGRYNGCIKTPDEVCIGDVFGDYHFLWQVEYLNKSIDAVRVTSFPMNYIFNVELSYCCNHYKFLTDEEVMQWRMEN